MAFEDLKERFQSEFSALSEKVQDSSAYIQLKERYENLTPTQQKLTLAGISIFAFYLVFSIPLGYFSNSSDAVTEFEDRRQLIRDMAKVTRDTQDLPEIPVPPDVNSLKSMVDSQLKAARLLPEQIVSTEVASERVNLIPPNLVTGVLKVTLSQLNLRQIVDLGFQLQNISSSVKVTDMKMDASAKDQRYYDVTYRLAVLNVPTQEEAPVEEPKPQPKRRGK